MKKGRRTRSIRGEQVDFDLMDVKAQIASHPKPTEVKTREDFIERRLNRRLKRKMDRERLKEQEEKKHVIEAKELVEKPKAAISVPTPVEEDTKPKPRKIRKKKIED